jgi:hypothetical protein
MEHNDTDVQFDRNMDKEVLRIVLRYREDIRGQQENLAKITRSIPPVTLLRRLLGVFFPLVEGNTKVYS